MSPNFNIDRPRITDEEIKKHQNFTELVERFKQQSLKQARGDESWWKNKKIRYSTVIAGVTVICTITYFSLFKNQVKETKTNETLITQSPSPKQNKETKTAFINAPSTKLKTPYSTYKVNNAKGGNITHSTSSTIKVPKNSFVDKSGKDIVGDVTIEYKEFHDVGDLITSGIPMAYDSAGTKYNLETAGMFDIRGSQDGEPVFIKADKKLEVELASANAERKFNQYYLDTLERNWRYIQKDHAKLSALNAANPVLAKVPKATNSKMAAMKNEIEKNIPKKIDSVKVIYTTRAERLPRPKEPAKPVESTLGKPVFKLDGSYDDFPELAAFNNVIFEVGPENKNYNKELHNVTWSDVKVTQGPVKGKNYLLTLSYRSRSEKLVVYPVLSGDDFDKAEKIYEKKLESYQALIDKRSAEEKKLMAEMQSKQLAYLAEQKKKQEAYDQEKALLFVKYNVAEQNALASNFNNMSIQVKATRLFEVSKFGIYNSDCPHPVAEGSSLIPIFMSAEKKAIVHPQFTYLVDHTNKTVYNLDKSNGFTINYKPGNSYSVCLFLQDKMYFCNKAMFTETINSINKTFTVEQIKEDASNLVDFKKAIEI